MRWFGVGLLAIALVAGCRSRKRYDGTCKTDADCLDFQKCAAEVCVRRNPIFEPYKPPVVEEPAKPARKASKPQVAPLAPVAPPLPPPVPVKPATTKPDLGPAMPRHRDAAQAGKFRLDA